MNRTKKQVYDYARANRWDWFVTLSTNKEKVDRYNDQEVERKLSKWLSNIRQRKAKDLKYLIVKERHKDGALHFHCLMAETGELEFVEAKNYHTGSDLWFGGQQVYNLTDWKLGWSTATKVKDTLRASNYITKYITKEMISERHRKRYWVSNNLDKGKVETTFLPPEAINQFIMTYTEKAKYTKKVVVNTNDYQNEIIYITV